MREFGSRVQSGASRSSNSVAAFESKLEVTSEARGKGVKIWMEGVMSIHLPANGQTGPQWDQQICGAPEDPN